MSEKAAVPLNSHRQQIFAAVKRRTESNEMHDLLFT